MPYLSDKVALAAAGFIVAAFLLNPVEQKIIPLSEEDQASLTEAYKIVESANTIEGVRDELGLQDLNFENALYDVQSSRRNLITEYQFSPNVLENGKTVKNGVTDLELQRAADVAEQYRGAILVLSQNSGSWGGVGTAFRISEDLVLTNAHNIGALSGSLPAGIRFELTDINGKVYNADFLGADGLADIALLRLKEPNFDLPYFSISDWSNTYEQDETIVSVGHPSLLGYWTTSVGKAMAGPMYKEENGKKSYMAFAALSISSGASGSPIFDLNGNLEGILYGSSSDDSNRKFSDGTPLASYLELESTTSYSLAYDFREQVLEWAE